MESPLMTPANESQQQGALEKALEEDWGRNAAQRSAYEPQKHHLNLTQVLVDEQLYLQYTERCQKSFEGDLNDGR